MRIIVSLILAFNLSINAQSDNYAGTYEVRFDTKNAIIEYNLNINSDGTFVFHSYSNHFQANPQEKNLYGKGTWNITKNIVTLETNVNDDINNKYSLNFKNTKGRIDQKSTRNKSSEIIPITMRIYDSDIPWIKGLKLTKT